MTKIPKNFAQTYRQQGFAVIHQALPTASLQRLRAEAHAIVQEFDPEQNASIFSTRDGDTDRDQYFFDSAQAVHCFLEEDAVAADGTLNRGKAESINKIGHALHDHNPVFADFCRSPIFAQGLAALGFAPGELWQTMYIYKQPQIGGQVRWHQDATYLNAQTPGVVGIWVALEDATQENGCLWMQPCAQQSPLREIYQRGTGLQRLDDTPWPNTDNAIALEVEAGSVVFFSDHTPHYSSTNTAPFSRQAFTMHFTKQGTQWSEHNWLQRPQLEPFLVGG